MSTRTTCPPDHKHGETLTCVTQHACHCTDCMGTRREYAYWLRHMHAAGRTELIPHRLVPATGTRRRIEALMTLGWSQTALAGILGSRQAQVSLWCTINHVAASSHERVAELYKRLQDVTPPTTTTSQRMSVHRTLALAQRRAYARPIDWDDIDNDDAPQTGIPVDVDELAVELAVDGYRVALTRAERHIAVTTLNRDRGYDDQVIARMLGVSDKTIARDREYLNLPAAVGPDGERIAA